MNNIKTFEQYNHNQDSLNEGLKNIINWAKRTFKPEELDGLVSDILHHLKIHDFDINKLTFNDEGQFRYHTYELEDGDEIKAGYVGVDRKDYKLYLNDELVTPFIDDYYARKIYEFLNKKWKNTHGEDEKRKAEIEKRKSEIKNRWDKYQYRF